MHPDYENHEMLRDRVEKEPNEKLVK